MSARRDPPIRSGPVALGAGLLWIVLTVLVKTHVSWLAGADRRISRAAVRATQRHAWLDDTARAVTQLGNPVFVEIAVCVLAAMLVISARRRLGATVLLAGLATLVVERVLKSTIDRTRPAADGLLAYASGPSFPSGHSAGAGLLAAVLVALCCTVAAPEQRSRRRVLPALGALAAVLACGVAASRVVLGVHYPSDVVGGLAVAVSFTATAFALLSVLDRRRA